MTYTLTTMRAVTASLFFAVVFVSGTANGTEIFGRLFTTPAERANLDNMRRAARVELMVPETAEEEQTQEAAPVQPPAVSVQGYVKRSDGKGTVWVNRQPVQENSSTSDVQVGKLQRNGNKVPLRLKGVDKPLSLKAGQVYDPETDSIAEDKARMSERQSTQPDAGTIGASPNERP